MSKISEAFQDTKAFIPFITGGDPSLEITEQLLYAMEEAGADIIEIGIPFSDPIAEGPVIQAANERALAAGCTTDRLFETVKKAREKVRIPMVFLTYLNPIYTYGKERFMERCRECGIQGVIVPDMPFEEKGELREVCRKYGIEIISLIAPTSQERATAIAREAEGYIYCVSSLGVTGMRKEISTDIRGMVEKVRQVTKVPCAVGFGISTPEQARQMGAISDGVIVGSRIVKIVEEYGERAVPYVKEYVGNMKNVLKKGL